MVMDPPKLIELNGWKAVLQDGGSGTDYYIYSNMPYDNFKGLARSPEVALKWLEDATGVTYNNLPAVKRSELRVEEGPKIPISQFPFRRGEWYRHTHYYHGEKRLGSIQVKHKNKRTETMTLVDGGGGILGGDLRWMCEQNGLRLLADE